MSKPVLVDSKTHQNVRVKYAPSVVVTPIGRNCPVIVQEFQHLAAEYPIMITKNQSTGRFVCVALFGFEEDENLFIENSRWQSSYVPLNIQRQPFLIGNKPTASGKDEHVVLLDEDDERVGTTEGEALFNNRGFPTPFMDKITSILRALQVGYEVNDKFIQRMLDLDLISPATFEIKFDNGEEREIQGLYTINQDRLRALDSTVAAELHGAGFLEPAYMMLASLGQMQKLIDRKNRVLNANG